MTNMSNISTSIAANKVLLQYRVLCFFLQCERKREGRRERKRVKANEIERERERDEYRKRER